MDGCGRPLVIAVTPGQAGDSPALLKLLAKLRVPRRGPGRPRTHPQALLGAKAYSPWAHHAHLRSRGITTIIPEPADQVRHRKNHGSCGGRPVTFDAEDYKNHSIIERAFNQLQNWRAIATRFNKHALTYRDGLILTAILMWLR